MSHAEPTYLHLVPDPTDEPTLESADQSDPVYAFAEITVREMWRVVAIYEWAKARGIPVPQLDQARAELMELRYLQDGETDAR